MKGPVVVLVGGLFLAAATPARAQSPFVFFGGGATIPVSLYKTEDLAKTGWMATAGVGVPVGGKGLTVGGEAYFGSNKHDVATEKTNLYGAGGWLSYKFGDAAKAGPYLIASAGAMKHDFHSTIPADNGGNFELAWSGGVGVDIPAGKSLSIWAETRYMQRGDTRFIPIFVGVSIPVGKKN